MARRKAYRRAASRRSNPRFFRDEIVTVTGVPSPLRVVRYAPETRGGILGFGGQKMLILEPLGGGISMKVPEKSAMSLSNPISPGELGYLEGAGLVRATRYGPSRGGILGFGGSPTLVVEGGGIPGGVGVVRASKVAALANPVYACPACSNPIRVPKRRGRFSCRHCGRGLALVG